ncbi:hypothetical protein [Clostridium tagluense]|uniref:Uncharacterized protein n=1 Tax=Clostridium tagluense TaxID=360422 RepID=A0A401USU9_9CLOT|nr:hypothetical protein [Clostridium tagluense]GCD12623.1 hypothetical protein Ctaglu_42460 [Clostridium tagluense]
MKRTVATIKQFDYTSKEEFDKDIIVMKKKGYTLIENGMYNNYLNAGKIDDSTWKFSAYFVKSSLL